MESTLIDLAIDEQAARLALMALRGTLPAYEPLDEERVRIVPDSALLSIEEAARLLASMPKPLVCYGDDVRGTLVVECELAARSAPLDRRIFESHGHLLADDDPLELIVERYGEEDHLFAVFSGSDSLLVSFAALRLWFRDYQIDFSYYRADDAFNPLVTNDPQYDEARRRGAKGILQLSSPSRDVTTLGGRHFPFPLPESASDADRQGLEKGLIDIAKSLLPAIEDEEEIATIGRTLVERAELPADSVWKHGRDPEAHRHGVLASQMKYFFDGRTAPPEIDAFIDACRKD
jgi:hypothetical protein